MLASSLDRAMPRRNTPHCEWGVIGIAPGAARG